MKINAIHARTALILAALTALACTRQPQQPPAGIIANGSFETVTGARPDGWHPRTWSGDADFHSDSLAHAGRYSVRISSQDGADASWSATVPVTPFSTYRFSGWIRTDSLEAGESKGALFNLHGISGAETAAIKGTNDWTELTMEFETGRNDAVIINCLFGGWGRATGTAWFDGLSLQLLESREMHPQVTVRTARETEPISPFIYGQFIEHLGRCIYGGIWAEMLEDRKFCYPVTDLYAPWGEKEPVWISGEYPPVVASPWKAAGPEGTVNMDSTDPFTGSHSPCVQLPGDGSPAGLSQEGLALIKNKQYTGRIVLSASPDAGPVTVRLVTDRGAAVEHTIPTPGEDWTTFPFTLTAPASSENAVLEITAPGSGWFRIGTVSLMPADNIRGWRPEVIALLEELHSPVYRWPGGNFVSGYDWRDGIGDRDRRPPRRNPAWTGVEHNDVGIHEYMDLMELIGAEPFIAVNTGLGTVEEVAEEVAYCNSPAETPMGRLRAANGRPEPWGVTWWAVGNEMYGSWQLGHMPLSEYVKKHNRTADAMRAVDPSVKLVAVGEAGRWSRTMLRECGDHMDLISEHIYCQERPGLLGHTAWLAEYIKAKADAHRRYREEIPGLAEKDIRIAMDEWNYWYGPYIFGELGTRYFLKDGLGVAIGLHEYFRNSDLYFMANYAQTVNVIGCIKTSRTAASLAATGQVLKLYRAHYGEIPVAVDGDPAPLDVAAAWKAGRDTLTIAVVNPTRDEVDLPLTIEGTALDGSAICHCIAGSDPRAYNEPGKPPRVAIKEKTIRDVSSGVRVPALSVSIFVLSVKQAGSDKEKG
ncbi:carbohydrate binding domain-containing protein [bacterium]|nr:carbohydrate binding domain-containing protein [bacterium]